MPQIKSREGIDNIGMYQLLHVYYLVDTYEKEFGTFGMQHVMTLLVYYLVESLVLSILIEYT